MDYEKFRLQVRDLATKAYKDLKEESKDYGELRQKCKNTVPDFYTETKIWGTMSRAVLKNYSYTI